jgi:predicted nucleotide-binding protein
LQEIEEAAERCSAGIFLFTTDDKLLDEALADKAVPRDNVIFEAGYFINAKGKDHVLIVREAGAKMPADLGGDIYASLEEKSRIGPIKTRCADSSRFCEGAVPHNKGMKPTATRVHQHDDHKVRKL